MAPDGAKADGRDSGIGSEASSREVEYQVSLAARLGYVNGEAHRELSGLCVETSKVLAGLLRALRQ